MTAVRALVLRAPGTNCDGETVHALERVRAKPVPVHINAVMESPRTLEPFQLLVIPGGFSYGDDVAAGKILANRLRIGLADHLCRFRDAGKLILGICNGFQVLIKAGLLPGWGDSGVCDQPATLANNDSGKFEDRWIHLVATDGKCPFLQGVKRIDLPIAHGEGKFVCRDSSVLDRLEANAQSVLRYAAPSGSAPDFDWMDLSERLPYPLNPNGSEGNIAGICDLTGRVFGLMPHPERFSDAVQHPHWTRAGPVQAEGDGLAIFRNAIRFFS